MTKLTLHREGTRLGGLDFGGEGAPVLLLHGLAGHAGEWRATAKGLSPRARVVAFDARGHGSSERRPHDLSVDAHVADAAFVIEELALGRAMVVGQSLGGLVAMHLAAARPDLVSGLVVAEADPEAGSERAVAEVERWLRSWPVPFASRQQAADFFGGTPTRAAAWADGLEARDGELRPAFEIEVMVRTLREALSGSHWFQWDRIQCAALVVRAENGDLAGATAVEMTSRLPRARVVEIASAGHDLHLDQPEVWCAELLSFLEHSIIRRG